MVLDHEGVVAHVVTVVQTAEGPPVEAINCPERIPQREGVITECKVVTVAGEMSVFIEQTSGDGDVLGTLVDPSAAKTFWPFQSAFVSALTAGTGAEIHNQWFADILKESISSDSFLGMMACRRATMGHVSATWPIGASTTPDGTHGTLVLMFESDARRVRATLSLVAENDTWRLEGMVFPPALPMALPNPSLVHTRLQSFLRAYNQRDWNAALSDLTPEFAAEQARLRPAVELDIRHRILGHATESGKIDLGFTNSGIIRAVVPLKLDQASADLVLDYATCGDSLLLNGYEIRFKTDVPVQISATVLEQTLELQLWRSGYGEVEVSCAGFGSVFANVGEQVECRAQRGNEIVRAEITFNSLGGNYDLNMVALE